MSLNDKNLRYRGRYAPSPTGPLHFGSLVAAVGSYLEAKTRNGEWLLRMENLDTPRCVPGAADDILRTLEACGFQWDGSVAYQSVRSDAYHLALHALLARGAAYPCACSRREITDSAVHGIEGPVYPGSCRGGVPAGKTPRAMRVNTLGTHIVFNDAIQGSIKQNIEKDIGDFVLRRADGMYAYQLAVVVDDAFQQITDVVRGADLLDSTPRQMHLQHLLNLPTPRYAHLPVALNAAGQKLSKQTQATAVDASHPGQEIVRALRFLGQSVPAQLELADLKEIWRWAITHWRLADVPRARGIAIA